MTTIVTGDDWHGIYINGDLKWEGQRVTVQVLTKLGILNAELVHLSDDGIEVLAHIGNFPDKLSEVHR